ncbi:MAG: hypothetical protein PVJ92_01815 [Candidatus Dependentiae bacterium]
MKSPSTRHQSVQHAQRDSLEHAFFSAAGTYIHPTAYVGPQVSLGENVKIGPYSLITGDVTIDDDAHIYGHVVIGSTAQDAHTHRPMGKVIIGEKSVIREFATIDAPKSEDGITRLGAHNYCMHFAHIAHDVTTGDHVTLTNNAQIAGHAIIEDHVLIMAHAAVHQRCRIGTYSALAPFSGCRQDIPPFCLFAHQPAAYAGLNRVKLKRMQLSSESINALKRVAGLFYQEKLPLKEIQSICMTESWGTDQYAQSFIQFIADSRRGISRATVRDGEKAW